MDVFLTKYNAAGSAYIYSTLIGGSRDEEPTGLAVDGAGNAFVTGTTGSYEFPVAYAIQPQLGQDSVDGFVFKMNATGRFAFSTYFGKRSPEQDHGYGLAINAEGDVYVAAEDNDERTLFKKFEIPCWMIRDRIQSGLLHC